jgi:hypothetical protein
MLRHRRPVDLAASAGVEIDGGLAENELKGQIRPFSLFLAQDRRTRGRMHP